MLHVIKRFTPRKDGWWFIGFWWNRINWRWAKVDWISCLSFRPKDRLHENFYLALRGGIQSLCNMSALVSLIGLPRQYCPLGLQFLLEFFLPWWRISGALIRVTVSFLDMILEEGKQPIGHSRRVVGCWGDKLTDLGMNSRKEKAWEIRSRSLICAQKLFLECMLHGGGNLACFLTVGGRTGVNSGSCGENSSSPKELPNKVRRFQDKNNLPWMVSPCHWRLYPTSWKFCMGGLSGLGGTGSINDF